MSITGLADQFGINNSLSQVLVQAYPAVSQPVSSTGTLAGSTALLDLSSSVSMSLLNQSQVAAGVLDTVVLGSTSSETAHGLTTGFDPVGPYNPMPTPAPSDPSSTGPSDTVTGALGLTGRRLLPRTPNYDVYGGYMQFTMNVDPVKQNYVTFKFWGNDARNSIWFVLNVNGFEIGMRHMSGGSGQTMLLGQAGADWFDNGFLYKTESIPLYLTYGQTSVTIKVRSLGWMSYYDSSGYFNGYQKLMNAPSQPIYEAFTSTNGYVDVSGEAQGAGPQSVTPRNLENETTVIANFKTAANNSINSKLAAAASSLGLGDLPYLATAYKVSWTTGYNNAVVITKVRDAFDAMVTAYAANPTTYMGSFGNSSWGGPMGDPGSAIVQLWTQLQPYMTDTVAYGGSIGTVTRAQGWSQTLRASVDQGRFHRRGTTANQEIACVDHIYRANQALLLVDPDNALYESEARRYLYEGAGLLPYLGNDQAGGGPVPVRGDPSTYPYLVSEKGTTTEGGFVSGDYGEQGPTIYNWGQITGDAQLQARGLEVLRARAPFRIPLPDSSGYRIMYVAEPIGNRNNGLPGHVAYLGRGVGNDLEIAAQGVNVVGADIVGYVQQQISEGQMLQAIASDNGSSLNIPDDYATVKAMAQTGVKLPMTPGQPDYAWADEQNMVLAAKHGNETLFVNLLWHNPSAITQGAMVFDITPQTTRMAEVMVDDVRFDFSGSYSVGSAIVDGLGGWRIPPDNPVNADSGQRFPVATQAGLTNYPTANSAYGGVATGYTLRYGNWLIAMNSDFSDTYTVTLPAGVASVTDLISGRVFTGGTVTLAPQTTVVFYLPSDASQAATPARPTVVTNTTGVISWDPSAGATGYNVKRSTVSGGPYTTLASNLGNTSYIDTTAVPGTTYYYVVSAVNASGESGNSQEITDALNIIGTAGSWQNQGNTRDKAFDGDLNTFFDANTGSGAWTGLDFGTAKIITQIKYAPRSAYPSRMVGGVFQASSTADFSSNVYTLYTVASTPPTGVLTTVTISGAPAYRYVRYLGPSGGYCNVAEIQFTANFPGTLNPPGIPSGLSATPDGNSKINLSWTASSGAAGYDVLRSTTSGGPYTRIAIDVPGTTFADSGLTDGTTYYYVVSAINGDGVSGNSTQAGATTLTPPSPPTGLSAVANVNRIDLSWTAVGGAVSYNVYQSIASGGPYSMIASGITATTFSDRAPPTTTASYYVVTAVNAANAESSASNEANAVLTTITLPAAPSGLTASAASATRINLNWTDNAGNETGFEIDRATNSTFTQNLATVTVGVNNTNYSADGLAANTTYYFRVRATNSAGDSANTATASATTPAVSSLGLFTTSVDVGAPTTAGYSAYARDYYTIVAAGADIGGTSDQFQFAYTTAGATGEIDTALTWLSNTNSAAKGGLMYRDSTAANAAYAYLWASPSNQVYFQTRAANGASTVYSASAALPAGTVLLRLLRNSANTFTALYESVGGSWTQLGTTQTVTMATSALVGLAVTSHNTAAPTTGIFNGTTVLATSNMLPTVATAAAASPSTVTGTTTALSVLGADDGGEANLKYTWTVMGPGAVGFSANGTNAARNTTATFTKAGTYTFTATIADAGGLTITSSANVTVNQTFTSITVSPNPVSLTVNTTQQFTASALDQFAVAMSTQPGFTWSVISGGGTINSSGLYTAPGTAGSATVRATSGSINGTSAVTITIPAPTAPSNLSAAVVSDFQINLSWTDNSSTETNFIIDRAANSSFTTNLTTNTVAANVTTYNATGLIAGTTYYFRVRATNAGGDSANSNTASATTTNALPAPWFYQDVGAVGTTGSSTYASGAFTVKGSGGDIGGSADSFQYAYQSVTGDATIIARFASATWVGSAGKAGVMMRDGLTSTSSHVMVMYDRGAGTIRMSKRSGSTTTWLAASAATSLPQWLRLQRVGSTFTGDYSSDGVTWTPLTSTTSTMASTINAGLAVCSRNTALATANFDNVSVNGIPVNAPPTVATPAAASPSQVTGTTTNLTVLGADDGGEPNLTYTWATTGTPPAAVTYAANGTNAAKNTTATFTKAGNYSFTVTIRDTQGLTTASNVGVTVYSAIVGRKIFYNNSKFDAAGNDGAIPTDKSALLPGGTAAFANYTSYSRGINAIMVDIKNLANPGAISASDFLFRVGNDNNPSAWALAPAPASVTVRTGAGTGGSDRVTIVWADNAIQNQWLKTAVLATANTGLSVADVFYFGNAVGESGDNSANAVVDLQDETNAWNNKSGFSAAAIINNYDYNRDGRVTVADVLVARHNSGSTPLQLITVPTGGPLAAQEALQPLSGGQAFLPAVVDRVETPLPEALLLSGGQAFLPAVVDRVETPLPEAPRPQATAGYPVLLSASRDVGASDKQVPPALERVNQEKDLSAHRGDAAHNRPAPAQARLHDAIFARSFTRRSFVEGGTPNNSSASAEIETMFHSLSADKAGKQFSHAIDAVFALFQY